ncbi:carbon storage regulator [Sulfobacillus harzensis]|uniref:Translational regulator CsrA n=1 Tax=Sulfobacillus harzensis TaxID=2729629 RepID=A0A7Y0L701_9FIRM|nr:carbon storage regulator [Sulfobacillus harzensis]NMP23079.1 carbon storage regulator [Sulfobacillus harzensis]
MLVLTRKTNEALQLQEGTIRIVVLSIQGDQVKLGIEAPKDVTIMREEIVLAQSQNREAAESISPDDLAQFTDSEKGNPSPRPSPKSR